MRPPHQACLLWILLYSLQQQQKKLKEKFMSTYYNFHWTQQWLQVLSYLCIIYVWVCLWVFTHVFFVCDSSVAQIKDLAHARQTLYYRCIPLTLTFSFSIIFLWKLTSHFHTVSIFSCIVTLICYITTIPLTHSKSSYTVSVLFFQDRVLYKFEDRLASNSIYSWW